MNVQMQLRRSGIEVVVMSVMTVGVLAAFMLHEIFGYAGILLGIGVGYVYGRMSFSVAVAGSTAGVGAIWLITAGLGAGRTVDGLKEANRERLAQRNAIIADLKNCEQRVRRVRVEMPKTYRGREPTNMAKSWDAQQEEGLAKCAAAYVIPNLIGMDVWDLTVREWAEIMGPVVLDAAMAVALKTHAAKEVQNIYCHRREEEDESVHPTLVGVDLSQLPEDVLADLNTKFGTWKGKLLGMPKSRKGVLWPTLQETGSRGQVIFIGERKPRATAGQSKKTSKKGLGAGIQTSDGEHNGQLNPGLEKLFKPEASLQEKKGPDAQDA